MKAQDYKKQNNALQQFVGRTIKGNEGLYDHGVILSIQLRGSMPETVEFVHHEDGKIMHSVRSLPMFYDALDFPKLYKCTESWEFNLHGVTPFLQANDYHYDHKKGVEVTAQEILAKFKSLAAGLELVKEEKKQLKKIRYNDISYAAYTKGCFYKIEVAEPSPGTPRHIYEITDNNGESKKYSLNADFFDFKTYLENEQ